MGMVYQRIKHFVSGVMITGLLLGGVYYANAQFNIFQAEQGGTSTSTPPTADQILIGGDTANDYDVKTLLGGANINIATSSGAVTITGLTSGNWDGTWQGANSPDFISATTSDSAAGLITFDAGLISQASSTFAAGLMAQTKSVDNYFDFYNGTFLESFNATTTSNGSVITMHLENAGNASDDLTMRFSSGDVTLTAPTSIALTAGSDVSPTENFVYITEANQVLEVSTSDWPVAEEHIRVSYLLVPSASYVQSDGPYINQNWNDHAMNGSNQGHQTHMAERLRYLGAIYHDGIDGNGDAGTYVLRTDATPDTVYLKSTAGTVMQMHRHTFPAHDTSGTDDFHMVNSSVAAYEEGSDLYNFLVDADGDSMSGKYYNLVLAGSANKTGQYEPFLVNLPTCSYNNQSDAEADVMGCDVFALPRQFNRESSTGFLIARLTMKHTVGGQDLELISTVDIRGRDPLSASGGVAASQVTFPDNTFRIFDEADSTRLLSLTADNITSGNTRDVDILDVDGTWALSDAVLTQNSVPFIDANGRLDEDTANFVWDDTNDRLSVGTTENTVTIAGLTALGVKIFSETEGATDLVDFFAERHSDTAGFGAHLMTGRSRGTHGSEIIVQDGDVLQRLMAAGYDGTDYEIGGMIEFEVDGTPGANDMPGRIEFYTTPDGSNSTVERLRIDSTGNVGIATSSPYAKLSVVGETVAAFFTATTTATSTFGGAIEITETNATSTGAGGWDISDGCYAMDGVCLPQAGDIHDPVTLVGAGTYLSLSGQQITQDALTESDITDLTHTTDTNLTEEEVQDFAWNVLGGTQTGITVTYQDGTNDVDFVTDVVTGDIHGDGANCAAGEIPLGVDANGAVQGCYEPTEADITDLDHFDGADFYDFFSATTTDHLAEGSVNLYNQTHTGDVTGATALTIGNDKVLEVHLKSVNAATDEYCLTYESTTGDFEWQECSAAADGYDFTYNQTTYNETVSATSTPLWLQDTLYASSTSYFDELLTFVNATGTDLTIEEIFISGDAISDFAGTGLSVTGGVLNAEVQTSDLHDAVTVTDSSTVDLTLAGQDITADGLYTAGDGLTLTTADFDCDTANGSTFGCLTAADWTTFNSNSPFAWTPEADGNATSTVIIFEAGLLSNASSTIGDGNANGGLTVDGNATTTGLAIIQGTGTSTIADDLDAAGNIEANAFQFGSATSTGANGWNISAGCYAVNGVCLVDTDTQRDPDVIITGGFYRASTTGNPWLFPDGFVATASSTFTDELHIGTGGNIFASSSVFITADSNDLGIKIHENSGLEFMDIAVNANGDLVIKNDAGTEAFTVEDSTAYINTPDRLAHTGDSNTYIGFTTDNMSLVAGALDFLNASEVAGQGILTVNNLSSDIDFQVEGDNIPTLVFADAGLDRVGVGGTTTPASLFSIHEVANFRAATTTFHSTGGIDIDAGCYAIDGVCVGGGVNGYDFTYNQTNYGETVSSTSTPLWLQDTLYASSTSFFAATSTHYNDVVIGDTDGNSPKLILDPQTGTEWSLYVDNASNDLQIEADSAVSESVDLVNIGAGDANLTISGFLTVTGPSRLDGAVTINEGGVDNDFRTEGDNDDYALFLEGSSDNFGVGTSSPSRKLSVDGNILVHNSATSTFTGTGGIDISSGCYAINSVCLVDTDTNLAFPWTPTSYGVSTSTTLGFLNGFLSTASSTFTDITIFASTTKGSVFFAGEGGVLSEDNTQFFWDDPNNYLGIGINTPTEPLHVFETGSDVARFEGNADSRVRIEGTAESERLLIYNEDSSVDVWYAGIDDAPTINIGDYVIKQTDDGVPEFIIKTEQLAAFGTSSPYANLTVWDSTEGLGHTTFEVVNSASTTALAVDDKGHVNIDSRLAHIDDLNTYFEFSPDQADLVTGNVTNLQVTPTLSVFNPNGGALDFQVEGDNIPYNLFVDASTDNVGVGTSSPYAKLSVVGNVVMEYFHSTSTIATSTVSGPLEIESNTTQHLPGTKFVSSYTRLTYSSGQVKPNHTGAQSTDWYLDLEVPKELHGVDVTVREVEFCYAALTASNYIDSNVLQVYNSNDGTATTIDNDTTNITSGPGCHSSSGLPITISGSESDPSLLLALSLTSSGAHVFSLYGAKVVYDTDE